MKTIQEITRNRSARCGNSSTARRHRILSALLALVMTLGLVPLPIETAFAADTEQTAFTVIHHYPDEEYVVYAGTVASDGTVQLQDDETVYTAPYIVRPEPKTDESGNVLTPFSGFAVEEGEAAVTIKTDDPANAGAEISYESDTPQVILHAYYNSDDGLVGDPSDPDGEEIPDDTYSTDPDTEIAPISLGDEDQTFMQEYFKQYAGEYTLPDGSGWKITVGDDGSLSMSSDDGKANNAVVDSITKSGTSVTKVTFKAKIGIKVTAQQIIRR